MEGVEKIVGMTERGGGVMGDAWTSVAWKMRVWRGGIETRSDKIEKGTPNLIFQPIGVTSGVSGAVKQKGDQDGGEARKKNNLYSLCLDR